jgi:hypothetical protein
MAPGRFCRLSTRPSLRALLTIRRCDLVDELQQARPTRGGIATPRAAALEDALRVVRGARHCCFDCAAELELPVAVRIRASVLEERTGWRIEHMRLWGRDARGRPSEAQLDTKVLECRKQRAQHLRRGPLATRLIHSPLARGSGRSEFHVPITGVRLQWAVVSRTTCSSPARSAPACVRNARGPRSLLLPHLLKR